MESLDLSSPHVTTSPTDLTLPPHLKELQLSSCPNLRRLPRFPSSLSSLHLERCDSLCSMEDLDLSSPQLKELHLSRCPNLRRLPRLPSGLSSLHLDGCKSLCSMGDLSNLKNLSSLVIPSAAIEEIQGLGCLENLPELTLRELGRVKILPDLSNLKKLRSLDVSRCPNLVEIQGELPQSLAILAIDSCESLRKLPDLSSLKELQQVSIKGCKELKWEAILGSAGRSQANLWENLQHLQICGLEQMEILPDLSNLEKLRRLQIQSCANLVAIEGEFPERLEELEISSCINMQELPNLSRLNGLREVKIDGCVGLNAKAISSLCSEKSITFLGDERDGEDAELEYLLSFLEV